MSLPVAAPFDVATPGALLALIAAPLVAGATLLVARHRARARMLLGESIFAGLSEHTPLRRVAAGLLVGAVILAVLGAARPRWGTGPSDVAQQGIDVVIVLDVSRSMQADDIQPSRSGAAAAALGQMIEHLVGNRIGLVTFAGTALERSPLTLDTQAVETLVANAQSEANLMRAGTELAVAIETALNTLSVDDAADSQAIVLVSDGENLRGDVDAALARARDKGVTIYTVFAATENPTPLPVESGGTDVTRGDPTILARIASETGGQVRELRAAPGLAVEFRRLTQTHFDSATQANRTERFQWFIAAAIALLVLEALLPAAGRMRVLRGRKASTALAAAALLLVACSGTAAYQHVEAGNRAYRAGDFEGALAEYRAAAADQPDDAAVNYDIGNALHQLRRYEEATVASRAAAEATDDPALSAKVIYALGNHAFRRGEFSEARDHYIAVLRIDPTDRDAKANLELTLAALAPPPPPEDDATAGPAPEDQPNPGEDDDAQEGDGDQGSGAPTPADGALAGDGGGETGEPGSTDDGGTPAQTLEEAVQALQSALGELGPEVSREEALAILELARRANELRTLPSRSEGGVPAR